MYRHSEIMFVMASRQEEKLAPKKINKKKHSQMVYFSANDCFVFSEEFFGWFIRVHAWCYINCARWPDAIHFYRIVCFHDSFANFFLLSCCCCRCASSTFFFYFNDCLKTKTIFTLIFCRLCVLCSYHLLGVQHFRLISMAFADYIPTFCAIDC